MSGRKHHDPLIVSLSSSERIVDQWRKAAALPFPAIRVRVGGEADPGASRKYVIEEDGQIVGTWREADAPWLYDYLEKRLRQLHGAWHLARTQLATIKRLEDLQDVAIAGRKSKAKAKRDAKNPYKANLQSEAMKLRRAHPEMLIRDIRARLAERFDASRVMLRALKVPRRRGKVPRP